MPKKKKPARELTNEEMADRVFGKKLKSQLKEVAKKREEVTMTGKIANPFTLRKVYNNDCYKEVGYA